jgi:hypothetical protein
MEKRTISKAHGTDKTVNNLFYFPFPTPEKDEAYFAGTLNHHHTETKKH